MADDGGHLVGEGGVVGGQVGDGGRQQQAVAVLVLEALAVERGPAGRRPQQEAPAPHVAEGPHGVAHPLEPEHRVEDVERDHGLAPRGVGGAGGGEGGHRPRLGDALLQDLAVLALPVGELHAAVDRLVALAAGGVDADLAEEGVEAEGAGLVGDDRHHPAPDGGVAEEGPQQAGEGHGGGHRPVAGAGEEVVEDGRGGLAGGGWRRPPSGGGRRRRASRRRPWR